MAQKRLLKPTLSNNLTDAAVQTIVDAVDAGVELDDILDSPQASIRGKKELSEEGLNELVELKSKGSPIPGQSLVNNPDEPYPWEQPPQFSNPREALDSLLTTILTPDAVEHILQSLVKGVSVSDLAMVILYSKFTEGLFNPDAMLLLAEPLMYIIMAIAEEADIEYNIEDGDLEQINDEDVQEKMTELDSAFEAMRAGAKPDNVNVEKLNTGALPQGLLDRIKEEGPKIRESLLSQGEQ